MKKMTTEEFVERANNIHNFKYDYSLVEYKNSKTKIKIICTEHGEFEINSHEHLIGRKCPKCANLYLTQDEFIIESEKLYGKKYDYSLVDYIDMYTKVKIICSVHGIFEKTPYEFLKNKGCKKCIYDKLKNLK